MPEVLKGANVKVFGEVKRIIFGSFLASQPSSNPGKHG